MNILEVSNVSKKYEAHQALTDINLNLEKGKILGLLGPNGAGKTSLIRIINQITAPDSGTVTFNGEKLERKHVEEIGYLPEERGLYRKMKIGEQAIYLTQLKGFSRADAVKKLRPWFDKFDLNQWWDKKIEDLSKGMAQKVQFITTVVHEPKLLILDEPFSGFDPINAQLVRDEIKILKEKGISIMLSTHNMASVEEICDEVYLINQSKNVLQGTVQELQNQFFDQSYKVSFEATNTVQEANFQQHCDNVQIDASNEFMNITLKSEVQLNQFLASALNYINLKEVKPLIPSMNDIFIKAINDQRK
jgi:ABC-2 type transport system ATP-binding protein